MRDQVEIVYVTPLEGAFTKPVASKHLGGMLDEPRDRARARLHGRAHRPRDQDAGLLRRARDRRFDLLVTIPLNMGADFVARSGLGDDLNYVPVDKHTLLSTTHDNIFAAR